LGRFLVVGTGSCEESVIGEAGVVCVYRWILISPGPGFPASVVGISTFIRLVVGLELLLQNVSKELVESLLAGGQVGGYWVYTFI